MRDATCAPIHGSALNGAIAAHTAPMDAAPIANRVRGSATAAWVRSAFATRTPNASLVLAYAAHSAAHAAPTGRFIAAARVKAAARAARAARARRPGASRRRSSFRCRAWVRATAAACWCWPRRTRRTSWTRRSDAGSTSASTSRSPTTPPGLTCSRCTWATPRTIWSRRISTSWAPRRRGSAGATSTTSSRTCCTSRCVRRRKRRTSRRCPSPTAPSITCRAHPEIPRRGRARSRRSPIKGTRRRCTRRRSRRTTS
mmetsp:Transcript_13066/g.56810  ORF Transcript_13066/g.56810 Transcript_13066/m.56810 type:complete len:257 (+) Transcript_13066:420-1190(+)